MDFFVLFRSTWSQTYQSLHQTFERKKRNLSSFFSQNIAFFWGLSLCSGIVCYLLQIDYIFIFWGVTFCIFFPFYNKRTFWFCFLLLIAGFFYAKGLFSTPLHQNTYEGYGKFHIQNIALKQSGFKKYYSIRGTFKKFITPHQTLRNISVYFTSKKFPELFKSKDLILQGTIQKKGLFTGKFYIDSKISPKCIGSYSQIEGMRFFLKEKIKRFVHKKRYFPDVANFFMATIFGTPANPKVQFIFSNIGLQHLLVISGFHFSLLTGLCFFLLRKVFSLRYTLFFCILFICGYFLLVGSAPSIERAWIVAFLYLWGKRIGKHPSSINLLGVSLLFEAIFHPMYLTYLGFYLSYFACLGILLYYPLIESYLTYWLPRRTSEESLKLSLFEKIVSTFLQWTRSSIALSLSVYLFLFPILIYFFQKIPLLSLFYNLVIPPLVLICFILFFLSLILPFMLPVCNIFTASILNILFTIPPEWNIKIIFSSFSLHWIILYLLGMFYLGILLKKPKIFLGLT